MENNDNYFEELINALPYCVIINKPIQDKNGAITDFKAMYFSKNTENEYIINGAKSDYEKFIRTLINIDGTTLFDIFREVYKTGKIQVHGVRLDTNSRDIDDITYVCFLKYRNEIVTLWNSKAKVSQKEQAIFEEQAHGFNALISSSDAGIIVKDLLGRVLDWNVGAEIITGYERSEVIGKYSEIFPNTEEYERVLEVNKRIIRGERVGHQSFNLLHKSGRIINCSAVYSPVFNSSKVLTGIVVVFFDITDATEAQKQARNLAAIFKIADAGVVIKDNRGVITDWNIGAENIFGYEKNEVVGKNHRLLFALENIGESEDITKAINLGKHIAHFETSRLHKKGNIIECSASITPTYDENGNVTGSVSIFHDITESKIIEREHKFYENTLNKLFNNLSAAFVLFELVKNDKGEDDLKIILANKTFRDFPDKPGGNIEGMCFSECCTGGLESLPLYIETAKTGRKISRQYYARTLQRYVAADIFSPEPGQVAVLISDQTHLVEAQRELEKAYIDTEAILHEIPAPICVISKNNGQILGYNKAFCDLVNIYDNDKLLNTQVMELFRKNNEATLRASFQAGGKFKTELVLSDKNIEVEIYARSFTYKEQNAYAVYLLDLTAQQLQEQTLIDAARQAEEASKMKSTFLANMSHEIRTPMNGVLGFTELALDDTELSDNTREYLEKIRISANSLLNIINAVLDISKIEAGKVEVETIPFSINEILRQCETISSPEALDKGLSLYFYSDPPIKKMLIGDPTKIRQILLNLVSNSVKFTETGMVKLMVYPIFKNDSSVEIKFEVIDTGIGMTAEQLKKVLIPFNQADSSTTRRYGGTGLGLTITNNLITLMGGELKIESAPGVGSRFSFTLGFKVDEKYPDDTINPLTNDIVMRPTFNGDVLLCEDNKINQQVIIEHLTRIGLKVSSASNGLVGLEIIKAREKYGKPFDLILMDIHMPVMDGLTTTSLILQMGIKAPIIAITANVMARDREIYQNHGMCDFISKPFKAEELWRCLLKYLAPISLVPIDNINSGNSLSQSPTSAINTRLGIERSANDEALYIRLKAYYLKDNADKPTLIKEALTEKDYRKALRLSHTLKSSSATIGAVAMSLVAGKMENAVSEGQYDYAYSLLGELSNTFNEVISELRGEINPLVKEDVIHTMLSAEESISLLDELEPLLLTGASETLDYLERLGDLPDNLATELKNRINDYDFEEALELLNKIRKHITK